MGMVTPRAEFVYVTGEKDDHTLTNGDVQDVDIGAWAAFAALEFDVDPLFKPYIGGYWYSGDEDGADGDIEAYNAISNNIRYSPVFGMENSILARGVPALGTDLYSGTPSMLGNPFTGSTDGTLLVTGNGYGAIRNAGSANSPGIQTIGIGAKGSLNKFTYKAQFLYMLFDDTGALEDVTGVNDIDDEFGWEADLNLTYNFNKHFSLGTTVSVFDPGDWTTDVYGDDFDETAWMDTVEMTWKF
jgi:hypothetical protein